LVDVIKHGSGYHQIVTCTWRCTEWSGVLKPRRGCRGFL